MISIFNESRGDTEVLQELLQAYAAEEPDAAMKDAELMQGDVSTDIDQCMARIESDYETIFESESEGVVLTRAAASLEAKGNCELSVSIIRLVVADM